MNEERSEPKKLTVEEVPELANKENFPEGSCCCYWKNTWTGWEKVRCTDEHPNEDECKRNTPSGLAYSWHCG